MCSCRQDSRQPRRKGARSRAGRRRHSLKSRRRSRWEKGREAAAHETGDESCQSSPRRRECEPSQDFQVVGEPKPKWGQGPTLEVLANQATRTGAGGWGVDWTEAGTDWVTFIRRSFTGACSVLISFGLGWKWKMEGNCQTGPLQETSAGILLCPSPLDGLVLPRPHHVVSLLLPDSSSRPVTHSRVCLALVVGPGEAIVCRSLGRDSEVKDGRFDSSFHRFRGCPDVGA